MPHNRYKYVSDEDKNEKDVDKIGGNIKKIDDFTNNVLEDFDKYLLVAFNNDENSYETSDGRLCNGMISVKLGDDEEAKKYIGKKVLNGLDIEVTDRNYRLSVLSELISRLLEAQLDGDEEDILNFLESLVASVRYSHLSKEEIAQCCIFERKIRELRDSALQTDDDVLKSVILVDSAIKAIDKWKNKQDNK